MATVSRAPTASGGLEQILDRLTSVRTPATQRLQALWELERQFGQAVLQSGTDANDEQQRRSKQWWKSQDRPATCVSQALVALLYRLHLACQALEASATACLAGHGYREGQDISSAIGAEMSVCFTILQGLCLRHRESQFICAAASSIELVLAIISASYWSLQGKEAEALPHAVDLLICTTMVSKSACTRFEKAGGESVVRSIIEKCMARSSPTKRTASAIAQQAVTMEAVQHSAVAMKCVELLLLLASERTEEACDKTLDLIKEHKTMTKARRSPTSPRKREQGRAGSASYDVANQRSSLTGQGNVRRTLSSSPVKSAQTSRSRFEDLQSRERRSQAPIAELHDSGSRPSMHSFPPNRLSSPSKRQPAATSALFDRSARTLPSSRGMLRSDTRPQHDINTERLPLAARQPSGFNSDHVTGGRSPQRSPTARKPSIYSRKQNDRSPALPSRRISSDGQQSSLSASPTRRLGRSDVSNPTTSTLSSPSKAMMGPSPAVLRAHARSVSPDKKRVMLLLDS